MLVKPAPEHPLADTAEDFFEDHDMSVSPSEIASLQAIIERAYESGREDAHHEIVCELEGGSISNRPWPDGPPRLP